MHGNTLPVTGENYVLMDMNTLAWVSKKKFVGGANFSAVATLPFAKKQPHFGYHKERSVAVADLPIHTICHSFWAGIASALRSVPSTDSLRPPAASSQVPTTTWVLATGLTRLSSGQTFYLNSNKRLVLSAFQMYEFHTTQEGTGIHPGETFDLDYSLMGSLPARRTFSCRSAWLDTSSGRQPPRPGPRFP